MSLQAITLLFRNAGTISVDNCFPFVVGATNDFTIGRRESRTWSRWETKGRRILPDVVELREVL